jgi:PPOX class probable F420-dependent enzyme
MTVEIPEKLLPLFIEPNYGSLGTVLPNGAPQVSPMWFEYDAATGTLRFTHTSERQKYRNLQKNPGMSFAIMDPADPRRYVEARGRLLEVIPDAGGEYYKHLQERYGFKRYDSPDDDVRVILVMSIEKLVGQ